MDIKSSFISFLLVIITGCGGEPKTDENEFISTQKRPNSFGQLLDDKVSGLNYIAGDYKGVTGLNGEFNYTQGDQIQFFVGDIAIGYSVEPKETLTYYELAHNNSFLALNIARFLRSLDDDSLLNNGIQIHKSSHSFTKEKTLDFLSSEWREINVEYSEIEQLVYSITRETFSGSRYLVSANSTYYDLASSFNDSMGEIKTQIENEIDIRDCKAHSECKIYTVSADTVGDYCPSQDTKYIYSKITTNIEKVITLSEEYDQILEVKSDFYSAASFSFPRITGVCITSFQLNQYPSCNNQNQCEFSDTIPITPSIPLNPLG